MSKSNSPRDHEEASTDHSEVENSSEAGSGEDISGGNGDNDGSSNGSINGGSPQRKRGRNGDKKKKKRRTPEEEVRRLKEEVRRLKDRERERRDAEKAEKARLRDEKKAARENRKPNDFIKAREAARAKLEPFEYLCKGAKKPTRYVWREREMKNGNKFWCPVEDKEQ